MKVIETVAPISIDLLKQYFADKETTYLIDYEDSSLKGGKLLTYLSNLDIPADIKIDPASEEFLPLVKDYLESPMLVNIESLEIFVIYLLLCYKGIEKDEELDQFISENKEIISRWSNILDSLHLYNLYIYNVQELKDYVVNRENDDGDSLVGINFVSLLKHDSFYYFYSKVDGTQAKYYKGYFNDYMFKGKNLYSFWATEKNPVFLTLYGVAAGIDPSSFIDELEKEKAHFKELQEFHS